MQPTTVVRMRRKGDQVLQDCDVYIGRQNNMGGWRLPKSKWANPFKLSDYGNSRQKVIDKYREYIMAKPDLLTDLHELQGKR